MRTQTGPESTLLAGANYAIFQRVKVANGSNTLIDRSDWVERITIDEDIDQPAAQATVELRRDSGSTLSLAPLRTDSTLNRLDDNVTYSPAIDAGRLIVIDAATVAIGATPGAGDWKELFRGYIDSWNAATPSLSVVALDQGGRLLKRWIKVEKDYGYDQPLATVLQAMLDDTMGVGVVPLTTVGAPAFNIRTGRVESQPLMEALRELAVNQRAWDLRYRWNGAAFVLTLSEPDRFKTTPDRTFGPSTYFDVTRLEGSRLEVRNYITLNYRNASAGYARTDLTTSDAPSIAKYDEQFFGWTLGDDSSVDTPAEASTLIGNVLADLKDPKAEQEIEAQFFWPAELHDLYRFSANGVHYNTNQDWAVTTIRHELHDGTGRTYLSVRGKPAGGFLTWIAQGDATTAGGLSPGDAADIEGWIEEEVAHIPDVQVRDEQAVEAGRGGIEAPDQAYDTRPWYDSTGATLLVNPATAQITTGLKYPTGVGIDALRPAEAGANVTETRTSADTTAVDGTAAATVKGGAVRANTGLDASGDVARDVPRPKAIANVPGLDLSSGKVDKDTTYDTGEAHSGKRDTARAGATAVAGGAREEDTRAGGAGVLYPGQAFDTKPWYDSTGSTLVFDPTNQTVTPKKVIGGGSTPGVALNIPFTVIGTTSTIAITGSDTAGRVTITPSGTVNSPPPDTFGDGQQLFTITFATAFAAAPHAIVIAYDQATAYSFGSNNGGTFYVVTTTTTATVYYAGPLQAGLGGGPFNWTYHILG